ncbi:MAG TPA: urate hydroxylase PuuD [Acidimicrobiia bacterium]|nr:urate hydroxylase PuuD [Acidimicrobiia bacterium]
MEIFHTNGWFGIFRMAHVIVAVMWMGLLWFFNMVQTPAYAEMDAGARSNALDKLTWRALWWFRWAAAATVVFGLLLLMLGSMADKTIAPGIYHKDYWLHSPFGPWLLIGILFGIVMFLNVWLVIWPQQQVVIGNARNVAAGGEADPNAAGSARAGAMASRQNTIFSLPLLTMMVGASHFWLSPKVDRSYITSGRSVAFIVIGIAVLAALEANALGYISGKGNTGLNWIYETHKNAIYTGCGLILFFYILGEILLRR